jgi:putative spermidine/putrescine transport system permease protein
VNLGVRAGALIAPSAFLIIVLFVALSTVLAYSLQGAGGAVSAQQYAKFLGDGYYVGALVRSLGIAAYCSVACLVLGYPIAYMMNRGSARFATIATLVLAIQFFSIYVVKMYGWMLVLGNNGIVNRSLIALGFIDTPVKLMYNQLGVAIGLVGAALPLMVFPISAVLQNVSRRYDEAALGLGANPWRVLALVTLPLSAPGIVGGVVLVFVFCFTAYLTPALLGGGFFRMIGNVIYEEAVGRFNYPMAATAAAITLATSLVVIFSVNALSQRVFQVKHR